MNTWRLIFWPSILTLLVSGTRLLAEVQGWVPPRSGGALHPLGITWIGFATGGFVGWRLTRAGSRPRVTPTWPWALLAQLLLVAAVMWQFGPFLDADQSDETFGRLRGAVLTLVAIASTMAIGMFVLWPRLAWSLLCYGLIERGAVVAITWLAKVMEWQTHYTRFGPSGIERDLPTTMVSAAVAQGGFWVPFTIVSGTVVGSFFGRRR